MMTPKSEEEIKRIYTDMIKSYDNPISDYPEEYSPKFPEIAELLNSDIKDLHIITEDEEEYGLIGEYFEGLIENEDEEEYIQVGDEDDENDEEFDESGMSGTWICYPNKKLAKWSSDQMGDMCAWMFSKEPF